MDNEKLVSVIITTYKRREDVLKRAVDSVLNQTYSNLELFIIDDSPSDYQYRDKIKEAMKGIEDSRVNYIQHERNKGACAARNTGIKISRGQYIAFLDDDDTWYPTKIEKQICKMNESACDFVYCGILEEDESKGTKKIKETKKYSGMIFDKLLWDNYIGPTSVALIKRHCFDKVGLFNEELKASQDYEMWLRITREFSVDYVDEALLHYYIYEGERISRCSLNKIQGAEMVNKIYYNDIIKDNKLHAIKVSLLVPRYISNRQFKKARQNFIKAYKLAPLFMLKRVRYNTKCLYYLLKFGVLNKK